MPTGKNAAIRRARPTIDFVTKALWLRNAPFDRVVTSLGFPTLRARQSAGIGIALDEAKNLNELEKATEAGFVVLIAIATQTREGRTGEPTDSDLIAAKQLFNKAVRKTTV